MQAKPKLLMLTGSYPRSADDETCGYVRELAHCLTRDFEVQVLAPADLQAQDLLTDSFQLVRSKSFLPQTLDPLQASKDWNGLLQGGLSTKILALISLAGFFLQAFRLARQADVICSHWLLPSGLIGSVIAALQNKPHIAIEHSGALHLLLRMRCGRWLAGFLVSRSDRIIMVSRDLQEKFLRLCPQAQEKTTVLPMGVFTGQRGSNNCGSGLADLMASPPVKAAGTEAFDCQPGKGHQRLYRLLFIGRLIEVKGVAVLLQALATLPNVQLLVAGEGHQRKALEQLATRLGIDAVFFGLVGRQQKDRLFAACDAVVIPSLILADGRTEGLPLVALETLAAGRPLIASRVGGLSEIIRDRQNGLLVEAGNSWQLADAIRLLRADKTLQIRLAGNARRTAEAFDWQIIGAKFSEILKDSPGIHGSVERFQTAAILKR